MAGDVTYTEPQKLIRTEQDLPAFRASEAYDRILSFIRFISAALPDTSLQDSITQSPGIKQILCILDKCKSYIVQCPPHEGARRFGNLAFREWHSMLEKHIHGQITRILPEKQVDAAIELVPYLAGSFGSAQRLDYGTGHELSFLAFLCALYQLGVLNDTSNEDVKATALVVFPRYNALIQELVVIYTLEPAGSHGVWGLDDHFAVPYLFGAAQLSNLDPTAFPTPADITKPKEVAEYKDKNFYFNAVAFINRVKKGPFWEHSPMLFDISGVASWSKIASGMLKMYQAEVLMKYPVVQHFPFGSTFFPFSARETRPSSGNQ